MTTSKDIEARRDGFRVQEAPATFQAAIKVARLPDIRYLWIDSLCIVQDDLIN
jgi:hypothetical protein